MLLINVYTRIGRCGPKDQLEKLYKENDLGNQDPYSLEYRETEKSYIVKLLSKEAEKRKGKPREKKEDKDGKKTLLAADYRIKCTISTSDDLVNTYFKRKIRDALRGNSGKHPTATCLTDSGIQVESLTNHKIELHRFAKRAKVRLRVNAVQAYDRKGFCNATQLKQASTRTNHATTDGIFH